MRKMFLLDSGAHSLYNVKVRNCDDRSYNFYNTDEFWSYVDQYCEFVIENKEWIDVYVSVDVIFNPSLSLKVQRYIWKKYNIKPLPVVHYGEDLKYLDIYMSEGYDYIGIGGLGQEVNKQTYKKWGDKVFTKICDKEGFFKIKTHGFAVTSHELLVRYPWYSCDATSWKKRAGYGLINMPKYINGKFDYLFGEVNVGISTLQPRQKDFNNHYFTFSKKKKEIVDEYIKMMGFEIGESRIENGEEIVVKKGLVNDNKLRAMFNIKYYQELEKVINNVDIRFKYLSTERKFF